MRIDNRRKFLLATGALVAARLAHSQPQQKVPKIGWLEMHPPAERYRKSLAESLLRLGYEEGRNLVVERRSAELKLERLPALADELVRSKVKLIVLRADRMIE